MNRAIALILALSVPFAAIGAAPPSEPKVYTRTGKWLANFDRDSCQLIAQFGAGDDALYARFTEYEPGDSFVFQLWGKGLPAYNHIDTARVDFGLTGKPVTQNILTGNLGKKPMILFGTTRIDGWQWKSDEDVPPKVTPEQEAAVTGATIQFRGKPFRLDFGSLAKPMVAMRACLDNLVQSWGYDPKAMAAVSRPVTAVNKPATWLQSEDFPLKSLWEGHNGVVQFRLDVDAEGKVVGCYVLDRTNPDDFADLTCKAVTKRAKLLPALDASGKPVRAYFVKKVIWLAG